MMVLATGLASVPVFLTQAKAVQTTQNVFLQDELSYETIEIKDLPKEVISAVANDYAQTVIKSAAIAETAEGKKVYKLSLEDSEGAERIVCYFADGVKYSE